MLPRDPSRSLSRPDGGAQDDDYGGIPPLRYAQVGMTSQKIKNAPIARSGWLRIAQAAAERTVWPIGLVAYGAGPNVFFLGDEAAGGIGALVVEVVHKSGGATVFHVTAFQRHFLALGALNDFDRITGHRPPPTKNRYTFVLSDGMLYVKIC